MKEYYLKVEKEDNKGFTLLKYIKFCTTSQDLKNLKNIVSFNIELSFNIFNKFIKEYERIYGKKAVFTNSTHTFKECKINGFLFKFFISSEVNDNYIIAALKSHKNTIGKDSIKVYLGTKSQIRSEKIEKINIESGKDRL